MERKRRRRGLGAPHVPQINLTPMIDTVLVLLIVFMMVTPMMHSYLQIDLPKSGKQSSQQPSNEKELILAIDRDGKLALNNEPIDNTQLVQGVAEAIQKKTDKGVTVYADQELAYRVVKKILDDINTVPEVTYVALAAEQSVGT